MKNIFNTAGNRTSLNFFIMNKIIFIIILLFFSCKKHTSNNAIADTLKYDIPIEGYWKGDCEGLGFVDIKKNNSFVLEVSSNQIYLKGKLYRSNKSNVYKAKYESSDVGRGGAELEWGNYEKDSIVAMVYFYNKEKAKIDWLGFYNSKTKERDWINGSEANGTLIKCIYE